MHFLLLNLTKYLILLNILWVRDGGERVPENAFVLSY